MVGDAEREGNLTTGERQTDYSSPDGECENMISTLKRVTELIKGDKLEVVVKRPH